jgi:hypothetical protein
MPSHVQRARARVDGDVEFGTKERPRDVTRIDFFIDMAVDLALCLPNSPFDYIR